MKETAASGARCWRSVGLGLCVLAALAVASQAATPEGEPGPPLQVNQFKLDYAEVDKGHPGLPDLAELTGLPLSLGKLPSGYVAPKPGVEAATVTLAGVPKLPLKKFYASAIVSIEEQIVRWFNSRGLVGVFVAPHPDDLVVELAVEKGKRKIIGQDDRRPPKRKDLRLVVWVGIVTKIRTVASGRRIPETERVNNPRHAHIRARSPIQPAAEGQAARRDLLRKDELERYTYFLSRHPGRRVDAALSSGEQPGTVVLDYLVNENKPWYAYFQLSNTGTVSTARWRERFGFVHNQLTGHDDILTIDYITARFDEAHAVLASYEVPVFQFDRLRWRIYGSWNKYTASDIGLAAATFKGKGWSIGSELIWNFFQHKALFLDAVAGARWEHHKVEDKLLGTEGEDDLFIPYLGLRFERVVETASLWGSATLEWNHTRMANTDLDELQRLGRLDPALRWGVLKFDANCSLYLEPLLNRAAWDDPASKWPHTLAHEVFFSVRGQKSLGDRLIPQHEYVVGGFYTVRGYPESAVAGDSAYVATAEYRFHVPRIFKPSPKPAKIPVFNIPFRFAPQQLYARPDWDLILRVFYDVGRVALYHRAPYERNQTLQGAGVGIELRFKSNFSIRCDYAVTLEDITTQTEKINSGHNRIHAIATLAF